MRDIRTTVSFDMRAPCWATPKADMYRTAIEMAAFADDIGVDTIGLMEHHGADDGFLPQPFALAAAIAAVTKNVRLMLSAVLLPLHDPVTVAEQIAVTDLISSGRMTVVVGAGYVPSEFAMFGKSLKDRARLMNSGIDTILRALRGERFEANGRPVYVRPLPVQRPEDIIVVGGGVPSAAKRAARFGLGFFPIAGNLVDVYLEECHALVQAPGSYVRPGPTPISIHLCEDPEQGWAAIEQHAIHVIAEYAKWADEEGEASNSPFKGMTDPAVLRQAGLFAAWTPGQLLAVVPKMPNHSTFMFQPLLGGLAAEDAWKSLELLKQTIPKLKSAIARDRV